MDGDETNALTRATADEVFDFIDRECQEVAANCIKDFAKLGDMSRGVPTEIGRADQLAALALRARAALYHASPLFNTNNDAELWHKAATACKELLDACTARGKVLSAKYNALWGPTAQCRQRVDLPPCHLQEQVLRDLQLPCWLPGCRWWQLSDTELD